MQLISGYWFWILLLSGIHLSVLTVLWWDLQDSLYTVARHLPTTAVCCFLPRDGSLTAGFL